MRPNLISDSLLINLTIDFLISVGGSASAISVVDYVMNISDAEPNIARLLASDLVDRDPRLAMLGDDVIFAGGDHDSIDLSKTGFVVFDLETTGAKTPPCRITEIGAYRILGGEIVEEFHTLVNPEMSIPLFISLLTGITDDMVAGAPKFVEVVDDFLSFIGDSVLVAHNAGFDMRFLNHEVGRVYEDYRLRNPSLCTVQLARQLLPDIENHRLKTVAEYFSVELVNHHRANADALATAKVFVRFLDSLRTLGVHDLGAAMAFSSKKIYGRPGAVTAGEFAEPQYHTDAA